MSVLNHKVVNPEVMLKEAFVCDFLKEVELKLYNSNLLKVIKVNTVILYLAMPWLKEDLKRPKNDPIVIILCFEDISSRALEAFSEIIHTGICENTSDVKSLCQYLGISIQEEVSIKKEEIKSYECDNSNDEHDSVNLTEDTVFVTKKKRIFSANLSQKDLTCNVCQRIFAKPYKLRIHSLIHSATPPFVCSFCGRGFNNKAENSLIKSQKFPKVPVQWKNSRLGPESHINLIGLNFRADFLRGLWLFFFREAIPF